MRRTLLLLGLVAAPLCLGAGALALAQQKPPPKSAAGQAPPKQGPKQAPQGQPPPQNGPGQQPPKPGQGAQRQRPGPPTQAGSTTPPGPRGPLQLASSYGLGEPIAIAVTEDGGKAYSVEGSVLIVLDLQKPELPALGRIALDAAVMGLLPVGRKLYIAGGAQGAGVMDLEGPQANIQWFDQAGGRPCTSIAGSAQLLVATFSALGSSELHVYARESLEKLGTTTLPGRPFEVVLRGERAFVALGGAGVGSIDLADPRAPKFERGPDLRKLPVPEGFKLPTGYVRDIALMGESLFLAADAQGLLEIDLSAAWSAPESVRAVPLSLRGKPTYAVRVDARGERIAVATSMRPALVGDAAPQGMFGRLGWNLLPAEYAPGDWPDGAGEGVWVFKKGEGGELTLEAVEAVEPSSWRGLSLRGKRLIEQHRKLGVVVREVSERTEEASAGDARALLPNTLKVVAQRPPQGIDALDGKASLRDPRLLLFGVDAATVPSTGLITLLANGQLAPDADFAKQAPLGSSVGAQWPDLVPTREWFLSVGPRSWRVNSLTHQPKAAIQSWDLAPPVPPDIQPGQARNLSAAGSITVGDIVLAFRGGTRAGVVGYSTRSLMLAATGQPPATRLRVKPLWQLETHVAGETELLATYDASWIALEDGRKIAVVAAGANGDPQSPDYRKPQIAVFDVTNGVLATPRRLAMACGRDGPALAVAVDVRSIQNHAIAFVATSTTGLVVFDVNEPEKPIQVGWLAPPVNPYDGQADNVLDVETWPTEAGKVFAFLACGRRGVVVVDVSTPNTFELAPLLIADTPGWATGLATATIGKTRVLAVGDGRAGLRLYR